MTNTKTFARPIIVTLPEVAKKETPCQEQSEMIGSGVDFQRIRRITGYLVGTVDRFNNAKRAEVEDRVKHNVSRVVEL